MNLPLVAERHRNVSVNRPLITQRQRNARMNLLTDDSERQEKRQRLAESSNHRRVKNIFSKLPETVNICKQGVTVKISISFCVAVNFSSVSGFGLCSQTFHIVHKNSLNDNQHNIDISTFVKECDSFMNLVGNRILLFALNCQDRRTYVWSSVLLNIVKN